MFNAFLIIIFISTLTLLFLYFILNKSKKTSEESFTFADYDKFPACWCKRDINII